MSTSKKRKKYTPEFKAKVALEAVKNSLTINQIAEKFSVHRNQVSRWKKELKEKAPMCFLDQNS